jgi:hypothetical protein
MTVWGEAHPSYSTLQYQGKEKKRLTLKRKKQYNLNTKNNDPDQHQGANSTQKNLSN